VKTLTIVFGASASIMSVGLHGLSMWL
jgi:hypothetical protein